jgi:hypothetical protein
VLTALDTVIAAVTDQRKNAPAPWFPVPAVGQDRMRPGLVDEDQDQR